MTTKYNLPVEYSRLNQQEKRAVREQYIKEQGNRCHFCGQFLDEEPTASMETYPYIMWKMFPKDMLKYPVHLHHDHGTDLTIGAVHAYCNCVLWQYFGE